MESEFVCGWRMCLCWGGGGEDFIVNTKEGKRSLGTAALDGQL